MNNLGGIARSTKIGELTVSALANLTLAEGLGRGIFHDTSIKGYRWSNFNDNYKYIQSYNSIIGKIKPTGSQRYFYGRLLDAPNKDGVNIGWSYTTDINNHYFNTGYSSSADFDRFQNLLRERVLYYTLGEDTYKNIFSLNPSVSLKFLVDEGNPVRNRGDLYKVSEEVKLPTTKDTSLEDYYKTIVSKNDNWLFNWQTGTEYQLFNSQGKLNLYKELVSENRVWSGFINDIHNRNTGKESIFYKINTNLRNEIKKDEKTVNPVIEKYGEVINRLGESALTYTIKKDYFEPFTLKQSEKNLKSFINPGIDEDGLQLYKNYTILTISEAVKKLKKIHEYYTYQKAYGIEDKDEISEYDINTPYKISGDTPITKYNDGGLTSYNAISGKRLYQYYEEKDGNIEITKLDGRVVNQNFVPSLTDFDRANSSKLLKKTNELFKTGKINSLINRFHTNNLTKHDELITSHTLGVGISRGRNLLKKNPKDKDEESTYDNPYCRVWTAHHQYSQLKHLIRPFSENGNFMSPGTTQEKLLEGTKLRPNGKEHFDNNSVLMDNGFVRMSPMFEETLIKSGTPIQNYMFSIENLAYKDMKDTLSPEQKGPHGGRIMWFPPYNLRFSENVNVNWNANNFIGRGEQIYTYTNTERGGTLDFTLLIDHPSVLNKWRGTGDIEENSKTKRDEEILRFFAGCNLLEGSVTPIKEEKIIENEPIYHNTDIKPIFKSKRIAYVVFFPNDFSGIDNLNDLDILIEKMKAYEFDDNTNEVFNERDKIYNKEILLEHNRVNKNSGKKLNNFSQKDDILNKIRKVLFNDNQDIVIHSFNDLLNISEEFKGDEIFGINGHNIKVGSIITQGFASSHGYKTNNMMLCNRRSSFIEKIIRNKANGIKNDVSFFNENGKILEVNNNDGRGDINLIDAKLSRAAIAYIDLIWEEDVKTFNEANTGVTSVNGSILHKNDAPNNNSATNMTTQTSIENENQIYSHDNEYLYFRKLQEKSYLVHNYIVDKVKFFDPAFHSITPEGFNSRLTFLHQCTRQGPTTSVNSGYVTENSNDYLKYAGNLSFGRAPYCILRIGDFFNTKICIESLSIQYDNGGGVQWDLNPEGVGVQPMYATVSIAFKFVGGQDISSPVEKLQNAITSNYYANASIYDKNADIIKK